MSQTESDYVKRDPADHERGTAEEALTKAIGEELRRLREARRWTRRELVRRMPGDVPVNSYACWENGLRAISIQTMIKICRTLEVTPSTVLQTALAAVTPPPTDTAVLGDEEYVAPPWADAAIEKINALRAKGIEPTTLTVPRHGQQQLLTRFYGVPVHYISDIDKRVQVTIDVCGEDG